MGSGKAKSIRRGIARKIFHPVNFVRLVGHAMSSKSARRVEDDAQLQLFAKIFPGGFLHLGYFDDPNIAAEDISFADAQRAQERYAELILEQITRPDAPVLDVGCGMGGLLRMMTAQGMSPTGVTPDRNQVAHIRKTQPDVPLEHCRFQDLDVARHAGGFGTVIHSESLQYIPLEDAVRVVDAVLEPGGRWIVFDYFRQGETREHSGHFLDAFHRITSQAGFRVVHEHDVTANVLPGMAFAHLLCSRLGVPVAEYVMDKIEAKSPAASFVLEDAMAEARPWLHSQLDLVHPEIFGRDKTYILYALERA